MQDFDNRLERLSYLLTELSKGSRLSTPMLVEQLGVSKKMIQTDFNTYILPFVEEVYYDGSAKCHVARCNFLQHSLVGSRALATMLMVKVKCSDNYSPDGLLESVDELFCQYTSQLEEALYAKAMVESLEPNDNRLLIENAISSQKVISCTYRDKPRELCPLEIINLEGFWYLVNWDVGHEDIRRYHLKSISDVVVLEASFTLSDEMKTVLSRFGYAVNAFFEPYVEPYVVELYVDARVAPYFIRMPLNKRQRIMTTHADGAMDIEIFITDDMEILPTIQKYLPYVRVIEPERLRDRVMGNVEEYRKF